MERGDSSEGTGGGTDVDGTQVASAGQDGNVEENTPEPGLSLDEVFGAQAELDAADQISERGTPYLPPTDFTKPYSLQLRREIKHTFPIDKKYYNEASKEQYYVISMYFIMRLLTMGSFLAFIVGFHQYYYGYLNGQDWSFAIPKIFATVAHGYNEVLKGTNLNTSYLNPLGFMLLVAALMYASRWIIRLLIFMFISFRAERLAHGTVERRLRIARFISDSCRRVSMRREMGGGRWSSRARSWTKVALWSALRDEYLYRYSTCVMWLVHYYTDAMEKISWAIKGAITLVSFALIYNSYALISPLIPEQKNAGAGLFLGIVLTAIAFLGWVLSARRGADFWTATFAQRIPHNGEHASHYFEVVSDLVENLVEQVTALERSR